MDGAEDGGMKCVCFGRWCSYRRDSCDWQCRARCVDGVCFSNGTTNTYQSTSAAVLWYPTRYLLHLYSSPIIHSVYHSIITITRWYDYSSSPMTDDTHSQLVRAYLVPINSIHYNSTYLVHIIAQETPSSLYTYCEIPMWLCLEHSGRVTIVWTSILNFNF